VRRLPAPGGELVRALRPVRRLPPEPPGARPGACRAGHDPGSQWPPNPCPRTKRRANVRLLRVAAAPAVPHSPAGKRLPVAIAAGLGRAGRPAPRRSGSFSRMPSACSTPRRGDGAVADPLTKAHEALGALERHLDQQDG